VGLKMEEDEVEEGDAREAAQAQSRRRVGTRPPLRGANEGYRPLSSSNRRESLNDDGAPPPTPSTERTRPVRVTPGGGASTAAVVVEPPRRKKDKEGSSGGAPIRHHPLFKQNVGQHYQQIQKDQAAAASPAKSSGRRAAARPSASEKSSSSGRAAHARVEPGSEEAIAEGLDREKTSGRYKGVTWDRVKRMWRVRLCLQGGARQHVGYYVDEEEGAVAYVQALAIAKDQGLGLKENGQNASYPA